MGKIMRNGNKYSCASPNNAQSVVYDNTTSGLEAENTKEAIDELSSKIDEQNENLGNSRIGFIDTTNIIFQSDNITSYTATQNCWFYAIIYNNASTYTQVFIDGVVVNRFYTNGGDDTCSLIPLKKGQTIMISGQRGQSINIFGMK